MSNRTTEDLLEGMDDSSKEGACGGLMGVWYAFATK